MTTPGTLLPVTFQNIGANSPIQICPSGSGSVNVYNGDIVNVLLVSSANFPGLTNSYPIQPLTNGTVDGSRALYAVAQSGTVAQVTVGGAAQLSPSPAQIAAQISALGLATAAKQDVNTAAVNTVNTSVGGTTIAVNGTTTAVNSTTTAVTGTTSAVNGVNTTTGFVNLAVQGINGNHAQDVSLNGNPFFTNPQGSADASGWTGSGGSQVAAGIFSGTPFPPGSGQPNGVQLTSTATHTFVETQQLGNVVVVPGQVITASALVQTNTGGFNGLLSIGFLGPTGTFLGTETYISPGVLLTNSFYQLNTTFTVPSTVGGGVPAAAFISAGISSGATITAGVLVYVTSVVLDSNVGGSAAGAHAQAIANTGVPLLTNAEVITQQATFHPAVTPGGTTFPSVGAFYEIDQIGYEINLATATTSGSDTFTYTMNWFDDGVLVASETWAIWGSLIANGSHSVYGKGPTKGSLLQVVVASASGAATSNTQFTLLQNSRIYARDDWRTFAIGQFGGLVAQNDMPALILMSQALTIATGITDTFVLPLFCGKVKVSVQALSNTNVLTLVFATLDPTLGGTGVVQSIVHPVQTDAVYEVALPRGQCTMAIKNTGTTSAGPTVGIVATEY